MTEQSLDFDEPTEGSGSILYGVTNRSNILEILGCGVAKPREAYPKYYTDLLEEVPGYVPVTSKAISTDVAEFVSAEAGQFPILFAFDSVGLSVDGADESSPWVAYRVVPVSHFKELFFRTDTERQEFLSREYENVPTESVPCRVNPEFFAGNSATLESFRKWKTSLPEVSSSTERIALADKLAGSYNMLAQVLPPTREWFAWFANEISGMSPSNPIPSVEAGIRRKVKSDDETSVLTGLIMRALAMIPAHQGIDPVGVISSLESQMAELSAKRRKLALAALSVVRQAVMGDIDLESVNFDFEDELLRAFTLAMTRPEPARFASWKILSTPKFRNSTPQAAIFVGLAAGFAATPVEYRGTRALQNVLSTLAAGLAAGSRGPTKPEVTVTEDGSELLLVCDGTAILRRQADLLSDLLGSDLKEGRMRQIAIELDRVLKLGCVISRVSLGTLRWCVDSQNVDSGNEIIVDGHVVVTVELNEERLKAELLSRGISLSTVVEVQRNLLRAPI